MITVIGSINLDLIGNVDRLPAPGETVAGSSFATAPGGKGANQALAARRAGAEVQMIGAVGDDAFAGEALELLKADGVDLSCIRQSKAATGTALILVGDDGENMIAVIPGANGTVLPGDAETAVIDPSDVVLLQQEVPLEAVEAAISVARGAGATSVLNTAPWRDDWIHLLEMTDIVVANETEFDLAATGIGLSGNSREEKMTDFVSRTGRTIIVTLGADGVVAVDADRILRAEAPRITPVDTVGAGDTFCGYFAAGLADGMPMQEAMVRAAKAGALACLKPGAQPAIPELTELD